MSPETQRDHAAQMLEAIARDAIGILAHDLRNPIHSLMLGTGGRARAFNLASLNLPGLVWDCLSPVK
jgi:hypothetical protein